MKRIFFPGCGYFCFNSSAKFWTSRVHVGRVSMTGTGLAAAYDRSGTPLGLFRNANDAFDAVCATMVE